MIKCLASGFVAVFLGLCGPAAAQSANIARFDAVPAPNSLTVEDIQYERGTDWFHEALVILQEDGSENDIAGIQIPLTGANSSFISHKDQLASQLGVTYGMNVRIDCKASTCTVQALYKR